MATRSLGQLTVDLIAKTGGFVQGMTAAERQSANTTAKIKRQHAQLARDLDKTFTTIKLAAAAAFVAIGLSVRNSIADMTALTTESRKVAMPIDQFSGLAAVAKDAHVEIGDLTTGLQTLARNLQTTRGAKVLEALGIDASKLHDTKQAFDQISNAFSRYRDDTDKVAVAQALFGRSGATLIPLLNQGSQAIGEQADEMHRLGVAFGPEAEAQLQAYDDASDQFSNTIKGLRNRLAIELLPALNGSTEFLQSMVGSMDGDAVSQFADFIKTLAKQAIGLGGAFLIAGKYAGGFAATLAAAVSGDLKLAGAISREMEADITATFDRIKAAMASIDGPVGKGVTYKPPSIPKLPGMGQIVGDDGTDRATKGRKKLTDAEREAIAAERELDQIYSKNRASILGLTDAQLQQKDGIEDANKLLIAGRINLEEYGRVIRSVTEDTREQSELAGIYNANRAAIQGISEAQLTFNDRMEAAGRLLRANMIDLQQYNSILADATTKLNENSKGTFDGITELGVDAAKKMQSAFADFLVDPLSGNFDDLAKSFGKMLARMAAEAVASRLFKFVLGGLAGSGIPILSDIGAAFTAPVAGTRATGGPVIGRSTYLVGEKGPELFTPNASGAITPNHALGGGGDVTVQVINQSSQPVNASVPRISTDAFGRMVATVFLSDLRVNGPMSRGLKGAMG